MPRSVRTRSYDLFFSFQTAHDILTSTCARDRYMTRNICSPDKKWREDYTATFDRFHWILLVVKWLDFSNVIKTLFNWPTIGQRNPERKRDSKFLFTHSFFAIRHTPEDLHWKDWQRFHLICFYGFISTRFECLFDSLTWLWKFRWHVKPVLLAQCQCPIIARFILFFSFFFLIIF